MEPPFRGVQPTLFGQRFAPLSQEQMVDMLEPDFPILSALVMDPWEELVEYRATDRNFTDMREADCAVWLTMQAQIRARNQLAGNERFRLIDQHQKLVIVIDDKIAVTIKKLTYRQARATEKAQLERSNYPTKKNVRYWNQQRDSGVPDYPRVILGYELLREITEIRLVIAYTRSQSRRVQWAYPIPARSSALPLTGPQIAALPMVDDEEEKGYTISPADPAERTAGGEGPGAG